jgi:hypothetical protein
MLDAADSPIPISLVNWLHEGPLTNVSLCHALRARTASGGESMRQARQAYSATGRVHLFMAAPAGLSFMLGQLLNTFGEVQTYEYLAERGQYVPSALLRPSQ